MKDFNSASKAPCIWTIILKKTRAWFWSWCSSFCSLQDSALGTANEIGLSQKNVNNNKSYLQPQTVFLSFCTEQKLISDYLFFSLTINNCRFDLTVLKISTQILIEILMNHQHKINVSPYQKIPFVWNVVLASIKGCN